MDRRALAFCYPRGHTLVDINRAILNAHYVFKPVSQLKKYLEKRVLNFRENYTLSELLTILKYIIRDKEMFDLLNPAMILCDKDLELALNMKALHVTEIREQVYMQIIRVEGLQQQQTLKRSAVPIILVTAPDPDIDALQARDIKMIPLQSTSQPQHPLLLQPQRNEHSQSVIVFRSPAGTVSAVDSADQTISFTQRQFDHVPSPPVQTVTNEPPVDPSIYSNINARFRLQPAFRNVFLAQPILPTFNIRQTTFAYQEITALLSDYIRSKKETFFDKRNIRAAMVKGDPLGIAFRVDSFHRCQVTFLLRKQIIYDPMEEQNEIIEESDETEYSDESDYEGELEPTDEFEIKKRPCHAGGEGNESSDEDSAPDDADVFLQEKKINSLQLCENDFADCEDNQTLVEGQLEQRTNAKCSGCKTMINGQIEARYCKNCWEERKFWLLDQPKNSLKKRQTRNMLRPKPVSVVINQTCRDNHHSIDEAKIVIKRKLEALGTQMIPVKSQRLGTELPSISTNDPKPITSLCIICCANVKNACFIHGKVGHQVSCYPCAKKLWKEQARCPYCRRKIEKIVKIFDI